MAETIYDFSISGDTLNGKVNNSDLAEEIRSSSISIALDRVDTSGDDLNIVFKDELSGSDETTLDSIVGAHEGSEPIPDVQAVSEYQEGTQGLYQCRGIAFDVPAGEEASQVISWPFQIRLCTLRCKPLNSGDHALAVVSEDTVIGNITQDVTAGDTVINVSQTVINNLMIGYRFKLSDGTNEEEFWVTAINPANKTVTIHEGTTNGYSASTPTYGKMSIRMTYEEIEFRADEVQSCGDSFLGGALIPAGTALKIYYHNSSGSAIRCRIKVEYWY